MFSPIKDIMTTDLVSVTLKASSLDGENFSGGVLHLLFWGEGNQQSFGINIRKIKLV